MENFRSYEQNKKMIKEGQAGILISVSSMSFIKKVNLLVFHSLLDQLWSWIKILKKHQKMKQINEILIMLPGLDCSACGSPSCYALAEDIVLGKAFIDDCVVLLKRQSSKDSEEVENQDKDKIND